MEAQVRAINDSAARIARECADRWTAQTPDGRASSPARWTDEPDRSISPDVNDPGARNVGTTSSSRRTRRRPTD